MVSYRIEYKDLAAGSEDPKSIELDASNLREAIKLFKQRFGSSVVVLSINVANLDSGRKNKS